MTETEAAAQVAAKLLGYLETTRFTPGWPSWFGELASRNVQDGTIMSDRTNVMAQMYLRSKTPWWDAVPELAGYEKVAVCSDGRVLALTASAPVTPLL